MQLLNIPILIFNNISINDIIEYIITGLIISRGSNAIYDLIDKIKNKEKYREENQNDVEDNSIEDT